MKQRTKELIYALGVGATYIFGQGVKNHYDKVRELQNQIGAYESSQPVWRIVEETPSYVIQAADLDGDMQSDVRAKSYKGPNGSVWNTEFTFEEGHGLGLDGKLH